jgi:hypothetical protein
MTTGKKSVLQDIELKMQMNASSNLERQIGVGKLGSY